MNDPLVLLFRDVGNGLALADENRPPKAVRDFIFLKLFDVTGVDGLFGLALNPNDLAGIMRGDYLSLPRGNSSTISDAVAANLDA